MEEKESEMGTVNGESNTVAKHKKKTVSMNPQ